MLIVELASFVLLIKK
ncbi:TPA: hypothetical protein I0F96_RS00370 [Enterococcus faecalis]|nr:hypothetical protein [Enterococcus faecalis]HBI1794106.1 hypothetical protein [Enterococcus faecalis]HBI1800794.1 hypothetical protein [Enterococcus faecalis]HBI1803545.1 hypothetical protein [Enterococcus faecalis]HBI1813479.1 hypothetical protein [Enterococcus faecalis]